MDNVIVVKATQGAAMTAAELTLARTDIKVSKSFKIARRALINGFIARGRTLEDMKAPPKDAAQAFWIDLTKLSFGAVSAKMSDKGAPDGKKYNVAALLEGKPADQPDWVNLQQYGADGKRTLRQYWQGQVGSWIKDVRKSWSDMEASAAALTATPDERTRAFNVIKVEQLTKVKSSIQKQTDLSFCPTEACKMLDELVAFIEES